MIAAVMSRWRSDEHTERSSPGLFKAIGGQMVVRETSPSAAPWLSEAFVTITIVIAGYPIAMPRPRRAQHGGVYMPSWFSKWKSDAQMQCQAAMEGRNPFDGACRISVVGVFPVPASWSGKKTRLALSGVLPHVSKPDADHLLQSGMDACSMIVIRDDRQFVQVSARKEYGKKPRMEIVVEELTPEMSFL